MSKSKKSGLNAAPFHLTLSLPNIQIPGREHLLGLEAWVTFWHLAGEDGAFV